MACGLILEGRLTQVYKPNLPTPSGFYTPPFHDDLDFDSYRLLGRGVWPASKVTYERKYELLAEIFTVLRRHAAGRFDELVCAARMPATIKMPEALFGDDVFFVLGLDEAVAQLRAEGRNFLALEEGFLRHLLEDGDNRLRLRWFSPPEDARELLERIAADLAPSGLSFEPLREMTEEAA